MNNAIFCDRDWTINYLPKNQKFICDEKNVKLLPYAKEWLKNFKKEWFLIVVITNQTGVWAGYYTKEQSQNVNNKIQELLWFKFDGIYSCYDKPHKNNKCRKPLPFMVEKACKDLNIDVKQSYFVWDKPKDIQTWINANCKWTCLIKWNYDIEENIGYDFIADNLLDFYNQLKRIK